MEPKLRALVPVANGSEDIEFAGIVDVLARGDIEVVIASVEPGLDIQLMKGLRIKADCLVENVSDQGYDAVVVPGGIPGAMRLGQSRVLREILLQHHRDGAVIAAVCLAPAVVLWPTGILDPCPRLTGNPLPIETSEKSYAPDEFTARFGDRFDPDARVCVDFQRRVITSQAPGTTLEFAVAIVAMLRGEPVAQKLSRYLLL